MTEATKATPKAAPKAAPKKAPVKKAVAPVESTPAVATEKKAPVKRATTTKRKVEFRFFSPASGNVQIAGSFNGWKASDMTRDENGFWSTILELAKGTHEYKFIFDGVSWEIDSNAPLIETDLGINNVVEVK